MREQIDWLRDALGGAGPDAKLDHYMFRGDRLEASNGIIYASVPFNSTFRGMIFGRDLETIVREGPADVVLDEKGYLVGTNFKAKLPKSEELPEPEYCPKEMVSIDSDLFRLANDFLPFCSDDSNRYYFSGIIIARGRIFAVSGTHLIFSRNEVADGLPEAIIPPEMIRFAAKRREGLIGMHLTENKMFLEWNDGRWARSNLIHNPGLPQMLFEYANIASREDWIPAPEHLRMALRQGTKLKADQLIIEPSRLRIIGERTRVSIVGETRAQKRYVISPKLFSLAEPFCEEINYDGELSVPFLQFRNKEAVGICAYLNPGIVQEETEDDAV